MTLPTGVILMDSSFEKINCILLHIQQFRIHFSNQQENHFIFVPFLSP
jgi:hypothetical protein